MWNECSWQGEGALCTLRGHMNLPSLNVLLETHLPELTPEHPTSHWKQKGPCWLVQSSLLRKDPTQVSGFQDLQRVSK